MNTPEAVVDPRFKLMHLSYQKVLTSIFPKFYPNLERAVFLSYDFPEGTKIVNVFNDVARAGFTFTLFNDEWDIVEEGLMPPSIFLKQKTVSVDFSEGGIEEIVLNRYN